MRRIVVKEWVTLAGVFDADLMGQWFTPCDSEDRRECIKATILASDSLLMGRATYEVLAPSTTGAKHP